MKKLTFFLLTDVLWYVVYVLFTYNMFLTYWRSLGLTGDGKMVVLFGVVCFTVINGIFILIQYANSIKLLNYQNNKDSYLKKKKIAFLLQNLLVFSIDIFSQAMRWINEDPNAPRWFMYFLLSLIFSSILYWYMINVLGRQLKWEQK